MTATSIVRALLREHPAARIDVDLAYRIHYHEWMAWQSGLALGPPIRVKVRTFCALWDRHRPDFL